YISKRFEEDVTVYLYTSDFILTLSMNEKHELKPQDEQQHYFNGVPVIEYENNKYRQGDWEDVIPLIDLYDEAQSDTANYMSDLNDAMLKIVGNLDIDVETAKEMKEHNILMLQTDIDADGRSSNADAD